MTKLDYLTMGLLVHISTDHANLLQLYDPEGSRYHIPRYAMNKMMRWATKLSALNYVIEHIPGDENVWADMLSRWGNHQSTGIQAIRVKMGSLVLAPVSPSLNEDYDWPRMADIIAAQPTSLAKSKWRFQENV